MPYHSDTPEWGRASPQSGTRRADPQWTGVWPSPGSPARLAYGPCLWRCKQSWPKKAEEEERRPNEDWLQKKKVCQSPGLNHKRRCWRKQLWYEGLYLLQDLHGKYFPHLSTLNLSHLKNLNSTLQCNLLKKTFCLTIWHMAIDCAQQEDTRTLSSITMVTEVSRCAVKLFQGTENSQCWELSRQQSARETSSRLTSKNLKVTDLFLAENNHEWGQKPSTSLRHPG